MGLKAHLISPKGERPSDLLSLVRAHLDWRRQVRGGEQRIARSRTHGLGLRPELCQRQPIANSRSLFAARVAQNRPQKLMGSPHFVRA